MKTTTLGVRFSKESRSELDAIERRTGIPAGTLVRAIAMEFLKKVRETGRIEISDGESVDLSIVEKDIKSRKQEALNNGANVASREALDECHLPTVTGSGKKMKK